MGKGKNINNLSLNPGEILDAPSIKAALCSQNNANIQKILDKLPKYIDDAKDIKEQNQRIKDVLASGCSLGTKEITSYLPDYIAEGSRGRKEPTNQRCVVIRVSCWDNKDNKVSA